MPQETLLAAYSITKYGTDLVAFGSDNLTTPIKSVRTYMVAQMDFAGGRLDRQRRGGQEIVGAMHAALGRGFFILLNSHFTTPIKKYRYRAIIAQAIS